MKNVLNKLLEIIKSGDRSQISFHIRDNFEDYRETYPFLHDRIDVGSAVERILKESKDKETINFAIKKIGFSEELKYKRRNYVLILADFYLNNNDKQGLESIVSEKLIDEFKFLGYRKLLLYYSRNYDEDKFLEIFKKIEKRKTLAPIDREGINKFIEQYASNTKNIDQVKELVRKRKIYPHINMYLSPMVIGYIGKSEDFEIVETIIRNELDSEYEIFFTCENIYNELYERADCKSYKNGLLNALEDLCSRIPKDMKVKGYPSKLWTLVLWRIGCKYVDLEERAKVEQIINTLQGENKSSLKDIYNAKWN